MFDAINQEAPWTGADFNILRVVAAFPLAANVDSSSKYVKAKLKEDSHPLATLSRERLLDALCATPEGESVVSQLSTMVERARQTSPADGSCLPFILGAWYSLDISGTDRSAAAWGCEWV